MIAQAGPSDPCWVNTALSPQSSGEAIILLEGQRISGQGPNLTVRHSPSPRQSPIPRLLASKPIFAHGASVEVGLWGQGAFGLMLTALHRVGISTPISGAINVMCPDLGLWPPKGNGKAGPKANPWPLIPPASPNIHPAWSNKGLPKPSHCVPPAPGAPLRHWAAWNPGP